MISVGVFINDKCIGDLSCHRVKEEDNKGNATYNIVGTNEKLKHNPKDGALPLAKKLINRIEIQPKIDLKKVMEILGEKSGKEKLEDEMGITVETIPVKSEEVPLATIYSQGGKLGIKFTNEAVKEQINYFLESYLQVERYDYESQFVKKFDDD